MIKLELKHLAPYLPYELQMAYIVRDEIVEIGNLDKVFIYINATHQIRYGINNNDVEHEWMFKPFLRSLSSMTKKEMYNLGELIEGELNMKGCDMYMSNYGMFQSIMLKRNGDIGYTPFIIFDSIGIRGVDYISYDVYEWLFKNHFDIFGLIKYGLAITKVKHKDYADINK